MSSRILSAAILAAAAIGFSACSGGREAVAPDLRSPIDVAVQAAVLDTGVQAFEVGGQVRARTTATLVSRIFADVQEVLVQPGDTVRAGQVLIRLDGRELQAQRARAEAAVAAADQSVKAATTNREGAEAALALATATHRRVAELRAKNSATPNELDQAIGGLRAAEARATGAQAGIREAEAAADAARAALRAATVGASYAAITAPFDGIVTEKRVELGNMATPGLPLMTVEDARTFRLEIRMDASRIAEFNEATPVEVQVDDLGRSSVLSGTVAEVARTLDGAHAFLVKIDLPANPQLRSGMFGRARFTGGARKALTVPASAVVRRGQLTSVFVVGKDNLARLRLVQVSNVSAGLAEIAAGLDAGEQVVVQPSAALVDGAPVRPVSHAAANGTRVEGRTEVLR